MAEKKSAGIQSLQLQQKQTPIGCFCCKMLSICWLINHSAVYVAINSATLVYIVFQFIFWTPLCMISYKYSTNRSYLFNLNARVPPFSNWYTRSQRFKVDNLWATIKSVYHPFKRLIIGMISCSVLICCRPCELCRHQWIQSTSINSFVLELPLVELLGLEVRRC